MSIPYFLPYQTTHLVGRDAELQEIYQLLDSPDCRLLTLVGLGGSGKTSLALAAAWGEITHFADGVYFVSLAPLRSSDQIVMSIANILGYQVQDDIDPRSQLLEYIADKELLFVLDGFDHLLKAVDLVINLLEYASRLKILITSREALNLSSEWVRQIQGLSLPNHNQFSALETYGAIQLFVERAKRTASDFSLEQHQAHVVRICRLVEGIPLAIELAAAWLNVLSCREIADEIAGNIDFLSTSKRDVPERHRSIRAVFEYSWQMLDEDERQTFMHLSVFRGSFTREAAEVVAQSSLADLLALVEKSLLKINPAGHYDLHELLRQFGAKYLNDASSTARTYQRHADFYAKFMQNHAVNLKGQNQLTALSEIDAAFDNVRAAWEWLVNKHDLQVLEQMLESLHWFCWLRARYQSEQDMYQYALNKLDLTQQHPFIGQLLVLSYPLADDPREQLKRGLYLAQQGLSPFQVSFASVNLAEYLAWYDYQAGVEEAIDHLKASLEYFYSQADNYYIALAEFDLAFCYLLQNALEAAQQHGQRSAELRRHIGDQGGLAMAFHLRGCIAQAQENMIEAEKCFRMARDLATQVGDLATLARASADLGVVLLKRGEKTAAQNFVTEATEIGLETADLLTKRSAFNLFSLTALLDDDYETCRELCEEMLSLPIQDNLYAQAHLRLAFAYYGKNNYVQTINHIDKLVTIAYHRPYLVPCLFLLTLVLVEQGKTDLETLAWLKQQVRQEHHWLDHWLPLIEQTGEHSGWAKIVPDEYKFSFSPEDKLTKFLSEARRIMKGITPSKVTTGSIKSPDELSEREIDVLRALSKGLSNAEIAGSLYVQLSTVKKHINHIYDKLNVNNRIQAVKRAEELGLI